MVFFNKKTSIEKSIEIIAQEAQLLVIMEFKKVDYKIDNKSSLNQVGLKNGLEIIKDYISEHEYGLAVDHIIYMVQETEIKLSEKNLKLLKNICQNINLEIPKILNSIFP